MDVKQLERMPLFARLGKRERERVARSADEVDVDAGAQLAVKGDLAYEFFVIEEGSADVELNGVRIDTMGPGDFFGEIGLLDSEHRRTATVTATSPMKLMVMTGHDFRALGRDMPGLESNVRAVMAQRLEDRPR